MASCWRCCDLARCRTRWRFGGAGIDGGSPSASADGQSIRAGFKEMASRPKQVPGRFDLIKMHSRIRQSSDFGAESVVSDWRRRDRAQQCDVVLPISELWASPRFWDSWVVFRQGGLRTVCTGQRARTSAWSVARPTACSAGDVIEPLSAALVACLRPDRIKLLADAAQRSYIELNDTEG